MKSVFNKKFRKTLALLTAEQRRQAHEAYRLFKKDPRHPSLQFKAAFADQPVYSVRIDSGFRALAIRDGDTLTWFWIGPHDEYMRLISSL